MSHRPTLETAQQKSETAQQKSILKTDTPTEASTSVPFNFTAETAQQKVVTKPIVERLKTRRRPSSSTKQYSSTTTKEMAQQVPKRLTTPGPSKATGEKYKHIITNQPSVSIT